MCTQLSKLNNKVEALVIVVDMDTTTQIQILNEAICISHCTKFNYSTSVMGK